MEQAMMGIGNYLVDSAMVFVPVLLILGKVFKSTPRFPDWGIPWALLVVSGTLCCLLLGFTVDALVQSVLVVGIAVYGNQLWKQSSKAAFERKGSAESGQGDGAD